MRLRVRFYETDLMGIVHHGSYVSYLEVARVEWLRRRGVAYATWAQRGLHLAVVDLALKAAAHSIPTASIALSNNPLPLT